MAMFIIWSVLVNVIILVTYAQHTLLYYDDMEDIQSTGWLQEHGWYVEKNTDNEYFCQGNGGYRITGHYSSPSSGEIARNFDINGYTDIVVAVDIGEVGLSGNYRGYLYYVCDPAWGQESKTIISLSESSNYMCDYNFTVADYLTMDCSNAKTLTLQLSMWTGTSAKVYLDEVRIYYGGTYSKIPDPAYDIGNGIYFYDGMSVFTNTGWVIPCNGCVGSSRGISTSGWQYCSDHDTNDCVGFDGNDAGTYITKYNMDTTANNFVAVQYVVGAEFNIGGSSFVQVQYTCGDGQNFQPIATHFGSFEEYTGVQHTVILPCTDSNTAVRLYSYIGGNQDATFDEICVVTWIEGENKFSYDACPNSVVHTDYSGAVYWYENFDYFSKWTATVPDLMTAAIWLVTSTADKPMNGQFIQMAGNDVSIISGAINGYSINSADIQVNIQTKCGRSAGDELLVEIFCDLATNNQQWRTIYTFYGNFEAENYIITGNPCNYKGINQIRFRSVATESDYIYIDDVYYCYNDQCPGDTMVTPNSGIIFYDSQPSNMSISTWISGSTNNYFRKRFNNLNNCNDLWIQFDILKPNFTNSDTISVEYRYDSSATESYCVGSTSWTQLTTYNGNEFVDQNIFQLNCSAQFYAALSITFSLSGNSLNFETLSIDNFYICNGRASCPAPYPTKSPTYDPTSDPTNDPTSDPTNDPTSDPTKFPSKNPSNIPSKAPTPKETFDLAPDEGLIEKVGVNCFSGYQDFSRDSPYYGKLCEACPEGTAGTFGKCNECGFLEVPNDSRDACEYYQPWWLWLAQTVFGLGIVGVLIWCCRKSKKKATFTQPPPPNYTMEMEMANTQGNTQGNYMR